jgi:uncharacterized protein DUF4232
VRPPRERPSRATAPLRRVRLLTASLLVAVVAGCGQGSPPASSASSAAATTTTSAARPAVTLASRAAGTAIPDRVSRGRAALVTVPRCVAADVEVSLDVQPRSHSQATGWTRALIVVSAESAAPCRLVGFAQVSSIKGAAVTSMIVEWVSVGRSSQAVTVRAGAGGFAAIGWLSGPDCPDVDGFDVVLPGDRHRTRVEVVGAVGSNPGLPVCRGAVDLGPFVASAQTANAEVFDSPTR